MHLTASLRGPSLLIFLWYGQPRSRGLHWVSKLLPWRCPFESSILAPFALVSLALPVDNLDEPDAALQRFAKPWSVYFGRWSQLNAMLRTLKHHYLSEFGCIGRPFEVVFALHGWKLQAWRHFPPRSIPQKVYNPTEKSYEPLLYKPEIHQSPWHPHWGCNYKQWSAPAQHWGLSWPRSLHGIQSIKQNCDWKVQPFQASLRATDCPG